MPEATDYKMTVSAQLVSEAAEALAMLDKLGDGAGLHQFAAVMPGVSRAAIEVALNQLVAQGKASYAAVKSPGASVAISRWYAK